jgi:hypothetical protein
MITCSTPCPPLPSPSTYAPYSPLPLLARLRTFSPSTFSLYIPPPLDTVQAATYGWTNHGRNSLACGVCGAKWDLSGVEEIRETKLRAEVARRLGPGLSGKHEKGCSWRVKRSPGACTTWAVLMTDTLYAQLRRLLHPPVAANLASLATGLERQCIAKANSEFRWTSPLVRLVERRANYQSSSQLGHLALRLGSRDDTPVSSFAAALALFCWYPFHPNGAPQTVSDTPTRTDIVQCRLCERRVGLWAFRAAAKESRVFDLVEEHLAWCPIRDQQAARKWWEGLPILREKETRVSAGKGWILVSGRMDVKPWRKGSVRVL